MTSFQAVIAVPFMFFMRSNPAISSLGTIRPRTIRLQGFLERLADDDAVLVTTAVQEKYICTFPRERTTSTSNKLDYDGPKAEDLVKTLFSQGSCTYRVETYWTYEVCHGRNISQYHEENEGNWRGARQLYYLGFYSPESDLTESEAVPFDELHPPKRKIDDQLLPYYPMRYTQGTICDINQKHRTATVLYFCFPLSRSQIYSVSEVSSCDYEVVILSYVLCRHPAFQPARAAESLISCYPLNGSPPRSVLFDAFERDLLAGKLQSVSEPKTIDIKAKVADKYSAYSMKSTEQEAVQRRRSRVLDEAMVKSVLNGNECFHGGSGWWSYEYCLNKRVIQYHEEKGIRTAQVLLGEWHIQDHLKWIADKPGKRPIISGDRVLQVTHFYSNGDICDLTGKRRVVEVRLRCWDKVLRNPDAVAIFLLEPKTCEYVITVESQIFCDYLLKTDDNGIIKKSMCVLTRFFSSEDWHSTASHFFWSRCTLWPL
ncbi:unnamed protein product [Soboliphyme baturini]|uniref:Endoplasmic reticulum lectin 1 n=1 Tax=Soboliphyme baturini TaxID=241478 RepID=A0A183IRU7_9BILA|nr:unnamed protein product [Soboliphyme baturini]